MASFGFVVTLVAYSCLDARSSEGMVGALLYVCDADSMMTEGVDRCNILDASQSLEFNEALKKWRALNKDAAISAREKCMSDAKNEDEKKFMTKEFPKMRRQYVDEVFKNEKHAMTTCLSLLKELRPDTSDRFLQNELKRIDQRKVIKQ